eukprot:TRINITY_DN3221_c0_g1_i1.p1 TRINITY_DN3221_c0_g1~~TRINITY_DN3221_c0_g1_i1.p1  ORF type:complete len:323 (-),score=123.39 TRINITY_DN3221_c0_g1_i1:122-1090(-)
MNSKLSVNDEEGLSEALRDLRSSETQLNWIMMSYCEDVKDTIEMTNAGEGGLEEVKENLESDQIYFIVLETLVVGDDDYSAVKFVLITFIGQDVGAGLKKAKAAGHRRELVDFIQQTLAIASEYQVDSVDELTSKAISSKLTKMSENYQDSITTGEKKDVRQNLSRSEATSGDVRLSQILIIDEDSVQEALTKVYKEELEWAILTYVEGKKDEIYLYHVEEKNESYADTPTKIEALKPHLEDDKIYFILFSLQVDQDESTVTKFLLITFTGEYTKPLQKARSSPHRNELANYAKNYCAFHSHFPATDHDDLKENEMLFKLRA